MFLYSQNSEKYSIRMPNKWNSSFDYFYAAIVALGIYVPGTHLFHWHILSTLETIWPVFVYFLVDLSVAGSPHMYGYMLGQRKKALAKAKGE